MLSNSPVHASQCEIELAERRESVNRLRLMGYSVMEISRQLGVSHVTVCNDISAVQRYWMNRAAVHRSVWVGEELAALDVIEREAAKAWAESTSEVQETTIERTGEFRADGSERIRRRKTKSTRHRDARLLNTWLQCRKQREFLLGLLTREQIQDLGGEFRKPKLLVLRDRQQVADLIDVTDIQTLEVIDGTCEPAADADGDTADR